MSSGKNITKGRFGLVCIPAYFKALSASNIINGFRSTSINLFDPNAIPKEAYGPSTISFQEDTWTCNDNTELDCGLVCKQVI